VIHALLPNNCLGLVDVLLLLIPLIISQLCERVPNPTGQSAVDCGSVLSMPRIAFTIGGKEFELAPEEVWQLNLVLPFMLSRDISPFFSYFLEIMHF